MIKLADECSNTLDHALIHLNSAHRAVEGNDRDQVLHDIEMTEAIIKNVQEMSKAQ